MELQFALTSLPAMLNHVPYTVKGVTLLSVNSPSLLIATSRSWVSCCEHFLTKHIPFMSHRKVRWRFSVHDYSPKTFYLDVLEKHHNGSILLACACSVLLYSCGRLRHDTDSPNASPCRYICIYFTVP